MEFSNLLPPGRLEATVRSWLDDDMPSLDVGGLVVGSEIKDAELLMKSPGVLAGKPFFDAVFSQLDCVVEWEDGLAMDGSYFEASSSKRVKLATITGPVNKILQGERTALNIISRCSGVATESRRALNVADAAGWKGWVSGTRKTTPGFSIVEKYGLLVGGVATHRLDLSQMVMLKDNHIWSQNNNITKAVHCAKKASGFSQKIEVECQNLAEAYEAANAGADIVMLDNYEPEKLKEDAATFKSKFPNVLVEASGGITIETMEKYLSEHVDIISQGKLTQGYSCIDYSLKLSKPST